MTMITDTVWSGQEARVIEDGSVRVVIVPGMGAKLVSLVDKRSGHEWLTGHGERPFRPAPYGASFVDQDMSGWDEMIPTIVACGVPAIAGREAASLPDHGEVWALPWREEPEEKDALSYTVAGVALDYQFSRTVTLPAEGVIRLDYTVESHQTAPLPYLWAAHPQFDVGASAIIRLPSEITEVWNALPVEWGYGEPEAQLAWPGAQTTTGETMTIDRIGPPSQKRARKFFVPPSQPIGWATLVRRPLNDWLRLEWDPQSIAYCGIWIDEGYFSAASVVAIEPMTGFYDSLAMALGKRRVTVLEPGEARTWTLWVRLGPPGAPPPADG